MANQNVLTVNDFDRILDNYAGRQIIHVPVTQTTSNISGEETLTDGTPAEIKAYIMRTGQNWDFEKAGFFEKGDAVALTKYADSVAMNDKIYADGVTVTISNIDGDATTITVDTSSNHGLSANDEVIISGTTNYDGVYTVATITDPDTFTISDTNHDFAAETSGYVVKDYSKFRVKERFDVPGVFNSTEATTTFTYTACNLFLET